MSSMWYKLDDNNQPVECVDQEDYAQWQMISEHKLLLRNTRFNNNKIEVSTVFLGLNHCYMGGNPILWETMIFAEDLPLHQGMDRYRSYESAIKGHYAMCQIVEKYLKDGVIDE